MRGLAILTGLLLCLPMSAWAQKVPSKAAYDTGALVWDHVSPIKATHVIWRCGTKRGQYTYKTKRIDAPAQRVALRDLVQKSGTTYCVAVAYAGTAKSVNSPEVAIRCTTNRQGKVDCTMTTMMVKNPRVPAKEK